MPDINVNKRIINYAQINKIDQDEARKTLEKEEERNEEDNSSRILTYDADDEVIAEQEYKAMIERLRVQGKIETINVQDANGNDTGIVLTINKSQAGAKYTYTYDSTTKTLNINANKCVVQIGKSDDTENLDDINIVLSGTNVKLNSDTHVNSITSSAINCIINGSAEDDNITATGLNTTINGKNGNDTITSNGSNSLIRGGSGDDDITSTGMNTNIFAGAGDDNIFARGVNLYVDAGSGEGQVNVYGNDIAVDAGTTGNKVISGEGRNIVVMSGNSANHIELSGVGSDVQYEKEDTTLVNPNDYISKTDVSTNKTDEHEADRNYDSTSGLNEAGYDKNGYTTVDGQKVNFNGYNENGLKDGYNTLGYNAQGYDKDGYDVYGYNSQGLDKNGYNKEGYNPDKIGTEEYYKDGYNKYGYDKNGYDKDGFNTQGIDKEGNKKENIYSIGKDGKLYYNGTLYSGLYIDKDNVQRLYKDGEVDTEKQVYNEKLYSNGVLDTTRQVFNHELYDGGIKQETNKDYILTTLLGGTNATITGEEFDENNRLISFRSKYDYLLTEEEIDDYLDYSVKYNSSGSVSVSRTEKNSEENWVRTAEFASDYATSLRLLSETDEYEYFEQGQYDYSSKYEIEYNYNSDNNLNRGAEISYMEFDKNTGEITYSYLINDVNEGTFPRVQFGPDTIVFLAGTEISELNKDENGIYTDADGNVRAITIQNEQAATIDANGNVRITSVDGTTAVYDKNGVLQSDEPVNEFTKGEDGKIYYNGELYSGLYTDTTVDNVERLYKNGEVDTTKQVYQNKLYNNGEVDTTKQDFNNVLYENGIKSTAEEDEFGNKLYRNGDLVTDEYALSSTGKLYASGSLATGNVEYGTSLYINGTKSTNAFDEYNNHLYINGDKSTNAEDETTTNHLYRNGNLVTDDYALSSTNKLYEKGTLSVGLKQYSENNLWYYNGEIANGEIDGHNYVQGVLQSDEPVNEFTKGEDGKIYYNGELYSGLYTDTTVDNVERLYKNGEVDTTKQVYQNKLYNNGVVDTTRQVFNHELYDGGVKQETNKEELFGLLKITTGVSDEQFNSQNKITNFTYSAETWTITYNTDGTMSVSAYSEQEDGNITTIREFNADNTLTRLLYKTNIIENGEYEHSYDETYSYNAEGGLSYKITTYNKDTNVVYYDITDYDSETYPMLDSATYNRITFAQNVDFSTLTKNNDGEWVDASGNVRGVSLFTGESAVIDKDGNVTITLTNGSTIVYDKNGIKQGGETETDSKTSLLKMLGLPTDTEIDENPTINDDDKITAFSITNNGQKTQYNVIYDTTGATVIKITDPEGTKSTRAFNSSGSPADDIIRGRMYIEGNPYTGSFTYQGVEYSYYGGYPSYINNFLTVKPSINVEDIDNWQEDDEYIKYSFNVNNSNFVFGVYSGNYYYIDEIIDTGHKYVNQEFTANDVLYYKSDYDDTRNPAEIRSYYNATSGNKEVENTFTSYGLQLSNTVYESDGATVKTQTNVDKDIYDALEYLYSSGYDVKNLIPSTSSSELTNGMIPFNLTSYVGSDIEIYKNADTIATQAKNDAIAGGATQEQANQAYTVSFGSSVSNALVPVKTSLSEASSSTTIGDVVEVGNKLYVNNGSQMVELKMSKEQYLKLFPVIDRYATKQGSIGDCYLISGILIGALENKTAFSKLIQMFEYDDNGDLTITFTGMPDYPVTFNGGKLYNMDGIYGSVTDGPTDQTSGCDGVKFLEQAYAIACFQREQNAEIDTIDIDQAIDYIQNGWNSIAQNNVFGGVNAEYKYFFEDTTANKNALNKVNAGHLLEFLNAREAISAAEGDLLSLMYNDTYIVEGLRDLTYYYMYKNSDTTKNIWELGFSDIKALLTEALNEEFGAVGNLDGISDTTLTVAANLLKNVPDYHTLTYNYEVAYGVIDKELPATADNKLWYAMTLPYDLEQYKMNLESMSVYDALKADQNILLSTLEDYVQDGVIMLGAGTVNDDSGDNLQYYIVSGHAYCIESVDKENGTVNVINPWTGALSVTVPLDEMSTLFEGIFVEDLSKINNGGNGGGDGVFTKGADGKIYHNNEPYTGLYTDTTVDNVERLYINGSLAEGLQQYSGNNLWYYNGDVANGVIYHELYENGAVQATNRDDMLGMLGVNVNTIQDEEYNSDKKLVNFTHRYDTGNGECTVTYNSDGTIAYSEVVESYHTTTTKTFDNQKNLIRELSKKDQYNTDNEYTFSIDREYVYTADGTTLTTTTYNKDTNVVQYVVEDKDPDSYPKLYQTSVNMIMLDNTVTPADVSQYNYTRAFATTDGVVKAIVIWDGESAVIGKDGTITVTKTDNSVEVYDKNGVLQTNETEGPTEEEIASANTVLSKIEESSTDLLDITDVTMTDGKISSFVAKYNDSVDYTYTITYTADGGMVVTSHLPYNNMPENIYREYTYTFDSDDKKISQTQKWKELPDAYTKNEYTYHYSTNGTLERTSVVGSGYSTEDATTPNWTITDYSTTMLPNIAFGSSAQTGLIEYLEAGTFSSMSMEIKDGQSAVISEDGTITITNADKTVQVYDKNGVLQTSGDGSDAPDLTNEQITTIIMAVSAAECTDDDGNITDMNKFKQAVISTGLIDSVQLDKIVSEGNVTTLTGFMIYLQTSGDSENAEITRLMNSMLSEGIITNPDLDIVNQSAFRTKVIESGLLSASQVDAILAQGITNVNDFMSAVNGVTIVSPETLYQTMISENVIDNRGIVINNERYDEMSKSSYKIYKLVTIYPTTEQGILAHNLAPLNDMKFNQDMSSSAVSERNQKYAFDGISGVIKMISENIIDKDINYWVSESNITGKNGLLITKAGNYEFEYNSNGTIKKITLTISGQTETIDLSYDSTGLSEVTYSITNPLVSASTEMRLDTDGTINHIKANVNLTSGSDDDVWHSVTDFEIDSNWNIVSYQMQSDNEAYPSESYNAETRIKTLTSGDDFTAKVRYGSNSVVIDKDNEIFDILYVQNADQTLVKTDETNNKYFLKTTGEWASQNHSNAETIEEAIFRDATIGAWGIYLQLNKNVRFKPTEFGESYIKASYYDSYVSPPFEGTIYRITKANGNTNIEQYYDKNGNMIYQVDVQNGITAAYYPNGNLKAFYVSTTDPYKYGNAFDSSFPMGGSGIISYYLPGGYGIRYFEDGTIAAKIDVDGNVICYRTDGSVSLRGDGTYELYYNEDGQVSGMVTIPSSYESNPDEIPEIQGEPNIPSEYIPENLSAPYFDVYSLDILNQIPPDIW